MKIKELITNLLTKNSVGIHDVIEFADPVEFVKTITTTTEYDKRNFYHYHGKIKNLSSIIQSEYNMGEREINSNSLDYLDVSTIHDGHVTFGDSLFVSDTVKDLKNKLKNNDSDVTSITYHGRNITGIIIAKNGVYVSTIR